MRILFFNPEQYVPFEDEPSNYQLRLPILDCGLVAGHHDHIYQRDLRAFGRDEMNRRALAAVADYRPDVVVYSASWEHENVAPWVLHRVRDQGIPVVSMLWDSWIESTTGEAELLAASTVLVVGDSLHTYLRCRLVGEGLTPSVAVAFAAGHQVYTRLVRPLPDEPKHFDVTLLGSNEGERARLVAWLAEELPRLGLSFNKAGGLVDSRQGHFRLTDDWVSWEDYVRIINRSRLCLNSATDPTRLQIKGKIFDYLACGVPCLTDGNIETRRFFPEGVVALFDGKEDCIAQIRRLLADETALTDLARTGREWFAATFDTRRFWSGVLRAATGEAGALPTLPILEDAFARTRARRSLLLRRELANARHLAALEFLDRPARRLSVQRLERRGRFHRMGLENGDVVATDRMPLDFLLLDDELQAAADTGAALPVVGERTRIGSGGLLVHAGDEAALDRRLDQEEKDG